MRAKTIAAFLAATAIVGGLTVPAGASAAKPHRVREPASTAVELSGSGTGGFKFVFFSLASFGDVVAFEKQASSAGSQSVSYSVRSHGGRPSFDSGVLDVRFGRLGQFRGRFVPTSTKTEMPQRGCTGDPTITETGSFIGSFAFHGEHGYTTVRSHREHGVVFRQGARSCPMPTRTRHERHHRPSRQAKEERERQRNEFHLVAGDAGGDVTVQARREESAEKEEGSPVTVEAAASETVGRLAISRSASVIDFGESAAAAFQVPNLAEPLAEATLAPPAPFSGSATFHLDSPKTASWTGDLSVELPGLGKVPLTGERIEAGLCKGPSHCTMTLPRLLQKVLESGPGSTYFYGEATSKPTASK